MELFGENGNFWWFMRILFKNENFGKNETLVKFYKKWMFWSKIKVLVKNENFGKKWNFGKNENFANKRKFW